MDEWRWHRGVQLAIDLLAGFGLGAFALSGFYWAWALGAGLFLLASVMWDAGEPQPGDPPRTQRTRSRGL